MMGGGFFSDEHIRAILSAAPDHGHVAIPAAAAATGRPARSSFAEGCSAESQKFLAAWQAWRGTQLLPRRHQVQLTSIARLMPQLIVLEVRGPDRVTFRLAGTDIETQFGARLSGRSVIALTDPAKQKRRGELIWQQVTQPCAALVYQELEFSSGRREIVEIASAPVLPDAEGEPVQIFGVVSRLPRHLPPAADGRNGVRETVVRNLGRNLRFLDIGAGIPHIASAA